MFIAGFAANSIIRSFSAQSSGGFHVEPREQEQAIARLSNTVAKLQTANAKLENELARMEESPSEVAELLAQRQGTKQAIRLSEEGGFSTERFRDDEAASQTAARRGCNQARPNRLPAVEARGDHADANDANAHPVRAQWTPTFQ